MRKNPAIWISLIAALLALAVSFGVRISQTQSEAILNLAPVLIALIIGGAGAAIRANVYSPESVDKALDMPQGSSVELLDQVLAAEVSVRPTDTKAEVEEKVERAEDNNG